MAGRIRFQWTAAAVLGSLLAGAAALNGGSGPGEDAAPKADDLTPLNKKLSDHQYRAMTWTRMNYFDHARRELRAADRVYQAMAVLAKQQEKPVPAGVSLSWDLNLELEGLRLRAKARKLMIDAFKLPADTLGFIQAGPYKGMDKQLWYVTYTVPPKGLTSEAIAADPMRYYHSVHIPGSLSYVASYTAKGPVAALAHATFEPVSLADVTFERVSLVAMPRGFTPTYVRLNHGGMLLVKMTSHDGRGPVRFDPTGAMLLYEGQLVEIPFGPCKGPVVVPRPGDTGIDDLATDGQAITLFAMKRQGDGAVIVGHRGRLCHPEKRVTFEGKHISKIECRGTVDSKPAWVPEFRAGQAKRLARRQVLVLGRFYGIRYEFAGRRVVYPLRFGGEPQIAWDTAKRQWLLDYRWGRMEIAGGRRRIVIDEQGKLVSITETLVLR